MELAKLTTLVANGESETLELKRSTSGLASACQTLCAFLNTRGGHVVIGVEPGGRVVGQEISDDTLRNVSGHLQKIEPSPPVQMETVDLENGLSAIVLDANWVATSQPFTYDGRPYQRVESTTQRMPREQYENLLLQRAHPTSRWENVIANGYTVEHLDAEEIRRTAAEGFNARRMPYVDASNLPDVLGRMELLVDGVLTNAALALYLVNPSRDFPQFHLRLARFRGVTKAEFLDSRQVHCNAFAMLDEAMLFLGRHLPVAGRIVPGILERQDEPLIPYAALREALVNAICHRNYSIPGGAVSVAIYDDRVEILNDGPLPEPLRIEDLTRDHASRPRNPIIADVFYRRGIVERWGRGTQRIVELCVEAGLSMPEYFEIAGSVGVRFDLTRVVERVQLSERQASVMELLRAGGVTSVTEIVDALDPPPARRTVQHDLAFLRSNGLVESLGHGPATVYQITEQGWKWRN